MSSFLSFLSSRVCQSIKEKELQGPPERRQRFLDLDLLIGREITLEWGRMKTESPRFKHHPPQRRPPAIHLGVVNVPASSENEYITNGIPPTKRGHVCAYISECVPANQTSFV